MKLDLHGRRHYEVDRLVENFILMNQYQLPLSIICGNSQTMINIVQRVIHVLGVVKYLQNATEYLLF